MSDRSERIYVVKDGERIGPYNVDELLARVDRGEILYEDFCLRQGDSQHVPVREVLDWDDADWREAGWQAQAEGQTGADDDDADADGGENEESEAWPAPGPRANSPIGRPDINDPSARLYVGHPALLSFPKSLLLAFTGIGVGLILWERNGWFLFGGLILALLVFAYILFERSMRQYLITPKRVEIVHGFIAKNSNEVRIDDIRAINVKKPGFIGLLGIGSVEFASAGGDEIEVVFTQVSRPNAIKDLVRRLQDRE